MCVVQLYMPHSLCLTIFLVRQIISSKKTVRRSTRRRVSARTTVLGTSAISPTTRVRAAAATTTNNPADKIIVSNLPADVNEVQIKVCLA